MAMTNKFASTETKRAKYEGFSENIKELRLEANDEAVLVRGAEPQPFPKVRIPIPSTNPEDCNNIYTKAGLTVEQCNAIRDAVRTVMTAPTRTKTHIYRSKTEEAILPSIFDDGKRPVFSPEKQSISEFWGVVEAYIERVRAVGRILVAELVETGILEPGLIPRKSGRKPLIVVPIGSCFDDPNIPPSVQTAELVAVLIDHTIIDTWNSNAMEYADKLGRISQILCRIFGHDTYILFFSSVKPSGKKHKNTLIDLDAEKAYFEFTKLIKTLRRKLSHTTVDRTILTSTTRRDIVDSLDLCFLSRNYFFRTKGPTPIDDADMEFTVTERKFLKPAIGLIGLFCPVIYLAALIGICTLVPSSPVVILLSIVGTLAGLTFIAATELARQIHTYEKSLPTS